jgi:hypothetical protein
LIAAVVATGVTLSIVVGTVFRKDSVDLIVTVAVVPGLLFVLSAWLAQTWDENRWPRSVERVLETWQRVTSKSERLTDSFGVAGQLSGGWRALLRPLGLCLPDEWLPTWRREGRRLLWLEWRSAWKVSLGLAVAGSGVLIALVMTSGSQTDLRFAISILPLTLAMVVFVLGVWSFHGEQREQRFRFFATHGASPIALWVVKHVVWLSCAILTVVVLLSVATLVSEKAILEKEILESPMRSVIEATRDIRIGWNEMNHVEPLNRFIFCLSNVTKTSLDEVFDRKDLPSSWPLISLVVLSMGRGLIAIWLCFAVGQLVSLVIPRAVTSMLVGLLVLGVMVAWWLVISLFRVPLVIAVLPVLIGLLAAAWGRMSDWLEERSGWRRWLRLAATIMAPMLFAFVGMAAYRVYEIPAVVLPWRSTGWITSTAAARQTGEDWVRLSERLESSWESEVNEDNHHRVSTMTLNRIAHAQWEGFEHREWLTKNAGLLNEAMQLAKLSDCILPKSWSSFEVRHREQLGRVAMLLKMSAFESLANHRLEEALQRALALYQFGLQLRHAHGNGEQWHRGLDVQRAALHVLREWAMCGDQTIESLLAALGKSKIGTSHPIAQLVRAEGQFAVDPQERLRVEYDYSVEMSDLSWRNADALHRWAFWEQWREERLLRVLAAEGTASIQRATRGDLIQHFRFFQGAYDRLLRDVEDDSDRIWSGREPLSRGQRWQQTTPDVSLGWGWNESEIKLNYLPSWASLEAHRRGLWLTIALQAHRLRHGKLPERLDELVGPFMERLPTDPISGQAFEYRADGVPIELHSDGRRLPPKTAYLAIPGTSGARFEPISNEYQPRYGVNFGESQTTGNVNWVSVFSIPPPYGQPFYSGVYRDSDTFSLAPSF